MHGWSFDAASTAALLVLLFCYFMSHLARVAGLQSRSLLGSLPLFINLQP
jgi:hypothetical protein